MANKKTAAILTVIGGVFYVIGGIVVAGLFDLLGSSFSGLSSEGSGGQSVCSFFSGFPCDSNTTISSLGGLGSFGTGGLDLSGFVDLFLAGGIISGALIIFCGWLINSEISNRRKAGAIVAAITLLVGGFFTVGGLIIGIILGGIGVYFALTYKSTGRMVIPIGPMASVTLGPQTSTSVNSPVGTGPLNYCTKCGTQIRPGSVFCGACGARLVE